MEFGKSNRSKSVEADGFCSARNEVSTWIERSDAGVKFVRNVRPCLRPEMLSWSFLLKTYAIDSISEYCVSGSDSPVRIEID